ncbi:hypothetical protein ACLMJK_004836 [Lecanora helva]
MANALRSKSIREDLIKIQKRMGPAKQMDLDPLGSYGFRVVQLHFGDADVKRGDPAIPWEITGKAVKAIEGYYYIYKDGPRELFTEIRQPSRSPVSFNLTFADVPSAWPDTLPWAEQIASMPPFWMEVYLYGKELIPSRLPEVQRALDQLGEQVMKEGENEGSYRNPASQMSYSDSFVAFHFKDFESKNALSRVNIFHLIVAVASQYNLPNHNPKELGIRVEPLRGKIAKVFFLFTSLD